MSRATPPPPGPVRPYEFPSLARDRLANGLGLISARHGDLPLVTAALIIEAGAAEEEPELGGLASLTVEALETGTRTRTADEIALALERLGVELESSATWDAALLSLTAPVDRLEPALELLADIVRNPAFPDAEIERLRDEQLAQILQRRKEPRGLANDMAARFIFDRETPYARPLIGTAESVAAITREQVEAHYRSRFTPAAATLLFVGDIDATAARPLADRFFGEWQGARAVRRPCPVPRLVGSNVHLVDRPGAVQSEIRIGHVAVERAHADYFGLLVLNTILGGAFTSRLNMSLREKHGFTYGASSAFGFRRYPGPFVISVAVATDVTARAVKEALNEVESLRRDGAPADEVDAARDYLTGVLPLELQTTEQLAARLADIVIFDLPDDYFDRYRTAIAAVSPADVLRVAREHLRPDDFAIVVVGDAAQIEAPLRDLGVAPIEIHRSEVPA